MSTGSIGALGQQSQQVPAGHDAWSKVDLDDFVKLLVTELQNQDPLEPLGNEEILQQISQIREIESNQRLTQTLQSVLLGQSVVTASNMLGRTIVGLSDSSETVTGRIDRVSIDRGVAKLHIGEHTINLNNVAEILPELEQNG
jgi:flagellar basal-body rod modification protein FlgD